MPEGSEIPGLTEETDQMVVSVNAPKAVEEDPIIEEELEDGEVVEAAEADTTDEASSSEETDKEESSEET